MIDIREQYPLFPVSDTEDITQALGYRHPRVPGNAINEVMTTDFLITVQDASGTHLEARHIKYEKDWKKPRETEKREIEATFWENRDVSFKSVTEKSINKVKVANIKRLLSYHDANRFQTESPQVVAALLEDMVSRFHDCSYDPLKDFCTQLEWRTNARQGLALELLFHLAAHKCIPVQIDKQLVATKPLTEVIDFSRLPRIPTLMEELNERFA
ncbi:TnsA endonuclease N-terminal domain-containing protein [Bengtsoniella intestinalis]|uniref:TnsA endonuclease N-terminal domain-containing protein n=1 Tax=Bengtsoniella intestinalis TaxID=3073143 RepID=UPI00391F7E96